MLKAVRFEILRGIKANGLIPIPLAEKPVKVATILDEAHFNEGGHVLIHNRNVFLEDHWSDWTWKDGVFTYFTRIAEKADVLIVYELA